VSDPAIARKKSKTGSHFGALRRGRLVGAYHRCPAQTDLCVYRDSYTDSDIPTSDAIMHGFGTGKIAWSSQVTEKGQLHHGLPKSPNCPDEEGPDYDSEPPDSAFVGERQVILVAAQKSGLVWGLDPDQKSQSYVADAGGFRRMLAELNGACGGRNNAYAAVSDRISTKGSQPSGAFGLSSATGEKVWSTPAPRDVRRSGDRLYGCAIRACSGDSCVVFSGAANGHFRAYATSNGAIVWDFDTRVRLRRLTKLRRLGIDRCRWPVIAKWMVLTTSAIHSGRSAGNVLLRLRLTANSLTMRLVAALIPAVAAWLPIAGSARLEA